LVLCMGFEGCVLFVPWNAGELLVFRIWNHFPGCGDGVWLSRG
jgi:hypothetical protein